MKTIVLTAVMLIAVFAAALINRNDNADHTLATELLSATEIQSVPLSGPPAFRHGERVAMFFERQALQGPIRGVVVIEEGLIEDVIILRSREGHRHRAYNTPDFLNSFRGLPAKPPVAVQAVSGATISSQALSDAISERLKAWAAYNGPEDDLKK